MSNPLGKIKSAGAERLAKKVTPSKIPHVQHGARIAAGIEHEQAQALNRALSAAGVDDRLTHDAEFRQQVLLNAADAISNQRFTEWWFEQIGSGYLDNAADAAEYVGLDGTEWREQIRDWHRDAYERGLADDHPDDASRAALGQTADNVVRGRFGVSLPDFVSLVINWDRAEATRQVFAGPMDAHTEAIRRLADEIEERNQRIAQLEAEVQ